MGPGDEVHIVSVEELGHDVGAESEGDAAVVFAPTLDVFVRIGPEEIAEQARVRNVGRAHDAPDLFHGLMGERGGGVKWRYHYGPE